ncbi:MAG: methyltransferase domain-containing protein [Anaerolineales bacterium]|nr:methyltransferase domain-containing protein [Anaerolineales bacterium]
MTPDTSTPPTGQVDFGDLRRVTPISRAFGFERGQPVDRYYIEQFLARHAADIHGRVLEIGDDHYTREFGGTRVCRADVLDLPRDDARPTIVADLTAADHVPTDAFDCIIFTQTLQYIFRLETAVATLHRILRPGGVLLGTFPTISQVCRFDMDRWGDYWRFTNAAVHRLLTAVFPAPNLTVTAHGNVLTAVCFLHGLSAHELTAAERDHQDPDYQLLITARAVKPRA